MELYYLSNFPYAGNTAFERGGRWDETTNSGLFSCNNAESNPMFSRSFRPVLATLWYNKFSYLLKQFFKENCIGCTKEV